MSISKRYLPLLTLPLLAWTAASGATQAVQAVRHSDGGALPALVRADPPSGASLLRSPRAVDLLFAGPLDARRSTLVVVSDAMEVLNGTVTVAGRGHDELRSALRTLAPGPYVVAWTVAAPGGAVMRRSYLFTVEPLGPPLQPDQPVALTQRAGGLTIGLRAPSDRVAHQQYTLTVSSGGRPLSGARVDVTGKALDMDMGESVASARAAGPGRYVAFADVLMVGRWQVTVTVRYGRRTARAVFVYEAHY